MVFTIYEFVTAYSPTDCQDGYLAFGDVCIQYFPDAGYRTNEWSSTKELKYRSHKFCQVSGGGIALDDPYDSKYNTGELI